ncbi:MAG: glucokinase [Desulfobulbaceae bacterium]|nr:glucokinase [Desulfobulbaceae bacterium]
MTLLLAADIGGTKSVLAIFDLTGDLRAAPLCQAVYANRDFSGLDALATFFLQQAGVKPEYACLAVAGVVRHGRAAMTNLPWEMSESEIARRFGFKRVWLINDLTAVCASVPFLQGDDYLELQTGAPEPAGVRAVIAPGTGLGEGFLVQVGDQLLARGSEGGHCDFAPIDSTQNELLAWVRRRYPGEPISYEMLCSGMAIPLLYAFFKASGMPESAAIREALEAVVDQTPVIVGGAIDSRTPCPLCTKTMDTFLAILGAEAGNLALKLYSTGGLYIGGGIMPRLVGRLSFAPLLAAFNHKEKMEALMQSIPVRLITRKDAALLGAAGHGRGRVQQ